MCTESNFNADKMVSSETVVPGILYQHKETEKMDLSPKVKEGPVVRGNTD
jgi:hypothetical protein